MHWAPDWEAEALGSSVHHKFIPLENSYTVTLLGVGGVEGGVW